MSLSDVYLTSKYIDNDLGTGHALEADVNVNGELVRLTCARCENNWTVSIPRTLSPGGIMGAVDRAIGDGKCRGTPLYRRTSGTPWFEYGHPSKAEAKR